MKTITIEEDKHCVIIQSKIDVNTSDKLLLAMIKAMLIQLEENK